jgi:transcriptional regulator with XRE-family HTH domain
MQTQGAGVHVDGARIRELRKLSGNSVTELARRAGISATYVSAIEVGRRPRVSAPVFGRICDALGVTERAQLAREPLRPPRPRRRPAVEESVLVGQAVA